MLNITEQEKLIEEIINHFNRIGTDVHKKHSNIIELCDVLSDNNLIYKCKLTVMQPMEKVYIIGSSTANFFFIPV